jgi:hypothetical protein
MPMMFGTVVGQTEFSCVQLSAWHYDFSLMTFAGFLVYGYVSVIPVVIWSALRYHGVGTSVAQLLCLYGYAQVVYIPAAVSDACPSSCIMRQL